MSKKAIAKGITKISLVVLLLAAIGFLVFNYALPVLAAHSSTAAVTPGVVQASTAYTFTVTISNDGGSTDPISEVRIYHDSAPLSNPSDFTNYACYPKTGWYGPFNITSSEGTYCLYTAKTTDDRIAPGGSADFTFDATSPETESCRNLHFESRDPQKFWLPLYDDVCVDKDPPVTTKEFIGPKKVDEKGVEWIDGVTQIVLNPVDPEPHPSGVDKTWYLDVIDLSEDACWNPAQYCNPTTVPSPYVDGAGCINSTQEWCTENWEEGYDSWEACVEYYAYNECEVNPLWKLYKDPFQKAEESCHVLQFFSIDNIGNIESMNTNCFFVDKTPPVLQKTIGELEVEMLQDNVVLSQSGDGTSQFTDDDAYVGSKSVHLTAGLITSFPPSNEGRIRISLQGITLGDIDTIAWYAKVLDGYIPHVDIKVDTNGDDVDDDALVVEYDKVQPPSDQLLGDMNFATGVWVNTFDDKGIVDDSAGMWLSSGAPGDVENPAFIYGTLQEWKDGLVDPSIDSSTKVVALEIEVDGWIADAESYVDFVKLNGEDVLSVHSVGPGTPVTFSCQDQLPHPSDDEEVCFKVSFDKEPFDLTSDYCSKYNGQIGQDGFCCVAVDENNNNFMFNFDEDSMHDLEYYCKDAVNKTTETEIQWYKVDSVPPVITKTVEGPQVGACPPQTENDDCYIQDGVTAVIVNVEDIGGEHDSGVNYCEWSYTVDGEEGDSGIEYQFPFSIIFPEDSTHVLTIMCWDNLRNEAIDEETFLVDSNPPETWKRYGEPNKEEVYYLPTIEGSIPVNAHYITSDTLITLVAVDDKVGVDETFYLIKELCLWDQDPEWECDQPEWVGLYDQEIYYDYQACYENNGRECYITWWNIKEQVTPNWTPYVEPFVIPQESIHKICFYSVDKLGNTEEKHCQVAVVDNTPPIGLKEVGDPKIPCNGNNGNNDNGNNNNGGDGNGNSPGDYVATIEFNVPCPSGTGVGIAFDGTNFWYSCMSSTTDLYKADADGNVIDSYEVIGGLGALAWDSNRNMLWAGAGCASGQDGSEVYLIDPETGEETLQFEIPDFDGSCLDDGLAYDGSGYPDSDSIYHSWDGATTIRHLSTSGGPLDDDGFDWGGDSCYNSGLAIGGDQLYQGSDGCNHVWVVDKNDKSAIFDFETDVGSDPGFRDEDLECDTTTFADEDIHVMWSVEAYEERRALAFEIPFGTCGGGGLPALCGDGIVDPGEECDDGNNVNGDGCSATCKVEGPKECDWWVRDEVTPITLDCRDSEPHPVDQETVCYRVSYDLDPDGYITDEYCNEFGGEMTRENQDDWCCAYVGDESYILNFPEESVHGLEYYCKDYLGNTGETDIEWFKVDSTPPETTKSFDGPFYENEGVEWIDGITEVVLDAIDPEPHPVGVDETWYVNILAGDAVEQLQLEVDPELPCRDQNFCNVVLNKVKNNPDHPYLQDKWQLYEGPFQKEEESCHVLVYYSVDELGNEEDMKVNCFFVDKQPPLTEKRYDGPFYENNAEWITSETEVILYPNDPEPHPSGVKATYWRNTLVADENCWDQELCQEEAQGSGDWNPYTDPFNKGEESCHLIEYYSVDNVNKTEEVNKQCVFVDNTAPIPNKTVKEPREEWYPTTDLLDPDRTNFYPEIVDKCWNGEEDQIECWKVTTMTPIKLDCTDPEPHPVDRETVFFMVDLDGEDVTQDYCANEGGNYNEETGWCEISGEEAPVWFKFKEETEHNLKYYCEDALGNAGPIDEEKFKVEGEKFKIDLNKKWNLISVPFRLLDGAMDKVWNDTAEEVITVWTYDPLHEMCGTDWCVYTPDGIANDNLLTMLPGSGYWVLANESTQLLVGGSLFSPIIIPSSKEMVNGWNLIGYYGIEDDEGNEIKKYEGPNLDGDGKPAICALGSLVNTVLGNPKWSALVNYWEPYNPDQWVFLDQFNYMNPGAGYWLELDLDPNEEEFYSFSTTCPIFP